MDGHQALHPFHPLVAGWFSDRLGRPTEVQARAWDRIAAGGHVLVTAPTGSGKTLAAFLWALNRLATGGWSTGSVRVLYVSPLKALNNDIHRNLTTPLAGLKAAFERAGRDFPKIRAQTRSGDTPQSERRRMIGRPPEILITTPESLNLMLTSVGGRSMLGGIQTVILDEIHSVLGTKRGTLLIAAVERLTWLAGEFQRVALSATVRPLDEARRFVGGLRPVGSPDAPGHQPRPVEVVATDTARRYHIDVLWPDESADFSTEESIWKPLTVEFRRIIGQNRKTLFFTNSRRLSERLTHKINRDQPAPLAWAHHGSLSREIRTEVERQLKWGDLKAIVATNSLELGIDVGDLDQVVLVQAPPSISAAVQRLGRAGHRVGEVSRGTIFPTAAADLIPAAVLARSAVAGDIEPIRPIDAPLDVLAQVIVSMTAAEKLTVDELYFRIKTAYPYRNLTRRTLDLVVGMLAGRYGDARRRELAAKVSLDRLDDTVSARAGARLQLYTSGGVIPDRGLYRLQHAQSGDRIGELDEEFVWEARIGDHFTLGAQSWRIERITAGEVLVTPAGSQGAEAPFWRGQEIARDRHFSDLIGRFLQEADQRLDEADYPAHLAREHHLSPAAADHLIRHLKSQKQATGAALPHRDHVLVEHTASGPGGLPGGQIIVHTGWGLKMNRPWAMALEAAWADHFGSRPRIYTANEAVVLMLTESATAEEVLTLVAPDQIETRLRNSLEGSGFFGAAFREAAGRALILTRDRAGRRMPLWISRLRAQKLWERVRVWPDFPLRLEAWRTCLADEFDLDGLKERLADLIEGRLEWTEVRTASPSPMARGWAWRQINEFLYGGDETSARAASDLTDELIAELLHRPDQRPLLARELVDRFETKIQRLAEGYAPTRPDDLLDWIKDRLLIPEPELSRLLAASADQTGRPADELTAPLAAKLVRLAPPGAAAPLIAARENLDLILDRLYGPETKVLATGWDGVDVSRPGLTSDQDPAEPLNQWFGFYGPRPRTWMADVLGLSGPGLDRLIGDLIDGGRWIEGRLTEDAEEAQCCAADNYQMLLRMRRAESRARAAPRPVEQWPALVARLHGLDRPGRGVDGLIETLERLSGLPCPAHLWETEILPARLTDYDPAWLDSLTQAGRFLWIGAPGRRAAFAPEEELDLVLEGVQSEAGDAPVPWWPQGADGMDGQRLKRAAGLPEEDFHYQLWNAVFDGRVAADAFSALRRGIDHRFKSPAEDAAFGRGRLRRSGRRTRPPAWTRPRPGSGYWFRLPDVAAPSDPLDQQERTRERVRVLLDRYGLLFKKRLEKELPTFRWPDVFRTLRLMELSGELVSGYFFEQLGGPQFMSRRAAGLWSSGRFAEGVFWMCAADPASPCGVHPAAFDGRLPPRSENNHVVFHGHRLVLASTGSGRELDLLADPDQPDLRAYFAPLVHLLTRRVHPLPRLVIRVINGGPAPRSPFLETLREMFDVVAEPDRLMVYSRRDVT